MANSADSSNWWRSSSNDEVRRTPHGADGPSSSGRWNSSWKQQQSGLPQSSSNISSQHEGQSVYSRRQQRKMNWVDTTEVASITSAITLAASPEEVQHYLERNRHRLVGTHVSAAFKALREMKSASSTSLKQVLYDVLLPALDEMLQRSGAQSAGDASDTGTQHSASLDARGCAVILSGMSHLQRLRIPAMTTSAQHVLELFLQPKLLQEATLQGVSMVAAGAAKLHLRVSESALQDILAEFNNKAFKDFPRPINISQTLWGVASLLADHHYLPVGKPTSQLFIRTSEQLLQAKVLSAANAIEVCNTLSAYAIAELSPSEDLVAALLQQFITVWVMERASSQDLARTIWALARVDADVPLTTCKTIVSAFCRPAVLGRAGSQDIGNMLWGLGMLRQKDAVTSHQLCIMASAILQHAEQHAAQPQEISTSLWGLATLEADLPYELMQQLQAQFTQPHILAAVAQDETQSLGLVNTLWAAAELYRTSQSRVYRQLRQQEQDNACRQKLQQVMQQEPVLPPAALRQLTDMLTKPSRVAHLSPCSVSLCAWSVATLGGALSYQQGRLLLQRFLQPRCQSDRDMRPQHFQNLVWGLIKLGREDVLIEDDAMEQILQAYFAAWEVGGRLHGRPRDPVAAAQLMSAVAHLSKRTRCRSVLALSAAARWKHKEVQQWREQQQQQLDDAHGSPASPTVKQQQASDTDEELWPWDDSSAKDLLPELDWQHSRTALVLPRHLLQRLFDEYMHAGLAALGNARDISMALWAAAVLRFPMELDDLQWLLSAFLNQQRLVIADASSVSMALFGTAVVGPAALLHASSGWRAGATPTSSPSRRTVTTQYDKLLAVQLQLLQELTARTDCDVYSQELSGALNGISSAYAACERFTEQYGWDVARTRQLQQGFLEFLQQLNVGSLQRFEPQVLIDVAWVCWKMDVVHEDMLQGICEVLLSPKVQQGGLQTDGHPEYLSPLRQSLRPKRYAATQSLQTSPQKQQQQLDVADYAQLLAALAGLNHLTDDLWRAAVQQCAGLSIQLHHPVSSREGNSTTTNIKAATPVVPLSKETAKLVPFICWSAAIADCRKCRGTVLQLCRGLNPTGVIASDDQHSCREKESETAGMGVLESHDTALLVDSHLVQLQQLYQIHLWLVDTAARDGASVNFEAACSADPGQDYNTGLAAVLTQQQLQRCRDVWLKQVTATTASRMQMKVAQELQLLPGIEDIELEAVTADGCFSIDIAAVITDPSLLIQHRESQDAFGHRSSTAADSRITATVKQLAASDHAGSDTALDVSNKEASIHVTGLAVQDGARNSTAHGTSRVLLAVEADGPHHFLYPGNVLNGVSRARSRALESRGYLVLRVPYDVWYDLKAAEDAEAVGAEKDGLLVLIKQDKSAADEGDSKVVGAVCDTSKSNLSMQGYLQSCIVELLHSKAVV